MKWIVAILVLLLPQLANAAELTVATFNAEFLIRRNIHAKFDDPLDLRNPERIAFWETPGRRDEFFARGVAAVADVVVSINADVIVLNEVGKDQDFEDLFAAIAARGLTYPHRALCKCTDSFTGQQVAVLSKFAFDEAAASIPGQEGYFAEPDDDDSQERATISKGVMVRFTAHNHTFRLYGMHLRSESGGGESDAHRIAQASIIRRLTLPAIIEDKELLIVAGDLNDGRGQPALRRIAGYDDIWPDLIQTGDFEYFESAPDTRWTYQFQGVRNQLDHILLSPSVRTLVGKSNIRPRVPEQTNTDASDHRPFVLTLILP